MMHQSRLLVLIIMPMRIFRAARVEASDGQNQDVPDAQGDLDVADAVPADIVAREEIAVYGIGKPVCELRLLAMTVLRIAR
jgi:hypothetical protein